jgi:hypothetical protein
VQEENIQQTNPQKEPTLSKARLAFGGWRSAFGVWATHLIIAERSAFARNVKSEKVKGEQPQTGAATAAPVCGRSVHRSKKCLRIF